MKPKLKPKPDYSQWLTKQQAAEAIGCSTKFVEQLARKKQIQSVKYKRPDGGPRIAVYHPADVEALRKKRNPEQGAFVVTAKEAKPTTALAPILPLGLGDAVQIQGLSARILLDTLTSQTSQKVHISDRLFLSLREAAEYSGLPKAHILRLLNGGELAGLKSGLGWRIPRPALEHYAYLAAKCSEPCDRAGK